MCPRTLGHWCTQPHRSSWSSLLSSMERWPDPFSSGWEFGRAKQTMPFDLSFIATLLFTRTNANEEPENVPSNDRYRLIDSNNHVSSIWSLILMEWKASEEKKVFVNTKVTIFRLPFSARTPSFRRGCVIDQRWWWSSNKPRCSKRDIREEKGIETFSSVLLCSSHRLVDTPNQADN